MYHDWVQALSYSKYSLLFLPEVGIEPAISRWFQSEALSNQMCHVSLPCVGSQVWHETPEDKDEVKRPNILSDKNHYVSYHKFRPTHIFAENWHFVFVLPVFVKTWLQCNIPPEDDWRVYCSLVELSKDLIEKIVQKFQEDQKMKGCLYQEKKRQTHGYKKNNLTLIYFSCYTPLTDRKSMRIHGVVFLFLVVYKS